MMNRSPRNCLQSWLLIGLCLAGLAGPAAAGEPQDRVKQTIDDVLAILQDQSLQAPEQTKARRAKIRQVVQQRFGFAEMGKRALGRHWRKLKPAQRQEFIPLFSDLLERSYISKIETAVTAEEINILYTKETIDEEGYAMVRTEVENPRDLNFEIDYRLFKRDGNWEAYDIVIEGVSLVNNYRTQFNKIIRQESYEALVKKLKLKIEQEEAAQ
ncbi:MlaC/ttg2D family ABC transporter substrate-binding protein [Candidatus Entotheonella palauensis]|nr:ABC transporter substrate-binding protein [Candidatus Entotheonella palauensis]